MAGDRDVPALSVQSIHLDVEKVGTPTRRLELSLVAYGDPDQLWDLETGIRMLFERLGVEIAIQSTEKTGA